MSTVSHGAKYFTKWRSDLLRECWDELLDFINLATIIQISCFASSRWKYLKITRHLAKLPTRRYFVAPFFDCHWPVVRFSCVIVYL